MDARPTFRNAAALMAQRLLHIVAAALFALMVPRLIGPAVFGRYALLTSVSMWFAMLSGLGAVSVMTRAVPPLVMADDMAGLRRLMSSLLALRTLTAVAAASLYFAIIVFLLDESDLVAASFIAGGVFCRTVANVCFSFFLGLNQAARWGLGDLLRRWLTLVLVLVGFPLAGLQGACAAFLIANLVVLGFGLARAWDYLHWSHVDLTKPYLGPFIRLGRSSPPGTCCSRWCIAAAKPSCACRRTITCRSASSARLQHLPHGRSLPRGTLMSGRS
jgi:O-antigen/teichoic acid export membrane protein